MIKNELLKEFNKGKSKSGITKLLKERQKNVYEWKE